MDGFWSKKEKSMLQDQLRKRAVIESVNNFLKNTCQIEHSRHRSSCNFVVNLMAGSCLSDAASLVFGVLFLLGDELHPFIQ